MKSAHSQSSTSARASTSDCNAQLGEARYSLSLAELESIFAPDRSRDVKCGSEATASSNGSKLRSVRRLSAKSRVSTSCKPSRT